jgi:4-phosphopantoate--beta-alanine ligase
VLAGKSLIRVAAILGCPIEVNIYYRTPERIENLLVLLKNQRQEISEEIAPKKFSGNWKSKVEAVKILGAISDGRILGLEGPRSLCSADGIGSADVILVPLEDGDRCEALIALGKQVLVIDLNPLSRTARQATVTIVDEVSRASSLLFSYIVEEKSNPTDWDNDVVLKDALEVMAQSVKRI